MNGLGGLALAFGAGIGSFLLPCTLPLIPGYLSYISGLGSEELQARERRGTLLAAASLFVLGFAVVFVALGATVSYIGSLLLPYRDTLTRASGIFIIFMAFVILGLFHIPIMYRDKRLQIGREFGVWSAFPLGMAFAFGWSPCIGPVLASILAYAATTHTAQQGALLLFVYALGFGLPFMLIALLATRMFGFLRWTRQYSRIVDVVGGFVLFVMGLFLTLNQWTQVMAPVMRWYADHNLPL